MGVGGEGLAGQDCGLMEALFIARRRITHSFIRRFGIGCWGPCGRGMGRCWRSGMRGSRRWMLGPGGGNGVRGEGKRRRMKG